MDEAKINDIHDPYDPNLWIMDDSYPYSLSDLENFPLSEEMEKKVNAIADEILGPIDEVQPAA